MIPTNRAVLGKDLDEVRKNFGMLVNDACWVFGLSITKWMLIVRQAHDKPVKDTNLALLVRFLDQHHELEVIPQYPKASEMFEMVNKVQAYDQKRFSVLFGSEASATYRWLKPGAKITPAVSRLMYYMRMVLLSSSVEKRATMMENWRETVEAEARARGVEDIFKTGAWKNKSVRDADDESAEEDADGADEEAKVAGEATKAQPKRPTAAKKAPKEGKAPRAPRKSAAKAAAE